MDRKGYRSPELVCYGPLADHTFPNPGADKSGNTTFVTDGFGEFSHPGGGAGS
jgi:hypothetical protein